MYQLNIFDLVGTDSAPDWRDMTLEQIANSIGEQLGLHFIPDTRFHGEFTEYIAYKTTHLFFTIGLSNYRTTDKRNGKPFIAVGYENKQGTIAGGGRSCNTIEEAINYFKERLGG